VELDTPTSGFGILHAFKIEAFLALVFSDLMELRMKTGGWYSGHNVYGSNTGESRLLEKDAEN
jgi:hypothetical protein